MAPGEDPREPSEPADEGGQPSSVQHKVHHSYIWLSPLVAVLPVILGVLGAFTFPMAQQVSEGEASFPEWAVLPITVLLILVTVAVIFAVQAISYRYLSYEYGAREFSVYSGFLTKKRVHVPYGRIQSVNHNASLFQRIAGVCTVTIDTAGSMSNKAITVPYILLADAEAMRTELFTRKQEEKSRQAGTRNASVAAQEENVLDGAADVLENLRGVFSSESPELGAVSYEYGLTNRELFLAGLSGSGGAFLIGFFGMLFSGLALLVPIVAESGWVPSASLALGIVIAMIVGVAVAMLVLGWVISIVFTCIYYGGFSGRRRGTRIEVEHGLLQHTYSAIDISRVQSLIVKQGFFRRLIGYCEVSLGRIDVSSGKENNQAAKPQKGFILHPFVKKSEVGALLQQVIPEFSEALPDTTVRLPKVSLRRALVRRCVWLSTAFWTTVCVALGQVIFHAVAGSDPGAYPPIVDIVFYAWYALFCVILVFNITSAVIWYRKSGMGYNERFVTVDNEGLSSQQVSLPRVKLQFCYLKTNPFQRASQVATINVVSAAGVGGTRINLRDVARPEAERFMDWYLPKSVGRAE